MSRQFVRFFLVGSFSAVVNIASRVVLSLFLTFFAAVTVAFMIGMTTSYTLNRMFVFDRSGRTCGDEYLRFGLVNMVALVQVWLVSEGLLRLAFPLVGFSWRPEMTAHVVGVATPIFTSYFGHKHFSFASRS